MFVSEALPKTTGVEELVARHRARMESFRREAACVMFQTIEDIVAAQTRQWAKRRDFAEPELTRDDLDRVIEFQAFPPAGRDRVYAAFIRERATSAGEHAARGGAP